MAAPHDTPAPRRRGRRRAGDGTRDRLLAAARSTFAEHGYDGATVRRIAERAGTDPAMVNHWFGGKQGLFTAALEFPVDPSTLVPALVEGGPDGAGERIVGTFLRVWDPSGGAALAAVVRSVAGHESAARMLREFLGRVLLSRVGTMAPDRPELRTALVGSQLIGMGMIRYVLKLEPLASAPRADVVAAVAPTVQRYLTGPLGSMNPDS